jgi:hypothetical protein
MLHEKILYTVKNTLKLEKIEIYIIVIFLATFVRFSLRTTNVFEFLSN